MKQKVMIVPVPVLPVINATLKEAFLPSEDASVLLQAAIEIWEQMPFWHRTDLCHVVSVSVQDRQNKLLWIVLSREAEITLKRHWLDFARQNGMVSDDEWSRCDAALVASLPKPPQFSLSRIFLVTTVVAVLAMLSRLDWHVLLAIWFWFSVLFLGSCCGLFIAVLLFSCSEWIVAKLRR